MVLKFIHFCLTTKQFTQKRRFYLSNGGKGPQQGRDFSGGLALSK